MKVVCVYFIDPRRERDVDVVHELAERLFQLTPEVAIRPPWDIVGGSVGGGVGSVSSGAGASAVFLEISRTQSMRPTWQVEDWILEIQRRAKGVLGVEPVLALATDPATAFCVAHYRIKKIEELPLEALRNYIYPFPPAATDAHFKKDAPKWEKILDSLKLLGLRTLGDFLKLPEPSLTSRFGIWGEKLMRAYRERHKVIWPYYRPKENIQEKESLLDPASGLGVIDWEPLLFSLKRCLDRVTEKLRSRALKALEIELCFEMGRGRKRVWRFTLSVPQWTTAGMLAAFSEELRAGIDREPLLSEVEELSVEVLEQAPGQLGQNDFFSNQVEEQERLSQVLARLVARLGEEQVFVAMPVDRHLPEGAWSRMNTGNENETPQLSLRMPGGSYEPAPRPTRLLDKPVPFLRVIEGKSECFVLLKESSQADAVNDHFSDAFRRRQYFIKKWSSPEKLSGEWWKEIEGGGFSREYYQVIAHPNIKLWVFKDEKEQWFLHGYFD